LRFNTYNTKTVPGLPVKLKSDGDAALPARWEKAALRGVARHRAIAPDPSFSPKGGRRSPPLPRVGAEAGLEAVIRTITRLCRHKRMTYDQTAYVMKLVRRRLGLAREPRPKKLPEIISAAEAERLIERAYRAGPVPGLIVKTLWMTMIRVSELVALQVPDVHCDDGYAKVSGGKGGKDRLIVLPRALAQELKSYIGIRRRGPLFVSRRMNAFHVRRVEQIVKAARSRARIGSHITPHTLRRSMATELLNRGVREEVVSTLLGHASTETTRASYARLTIKTMGDEVEQALATGARGGAAASRAPS